MGEFPESIKHNHSVPPWNVKCCGAVEANVRSEAVIENNVHWKVMYKNDVLNPICNTKIRQVIYIDDPTGKGMANCSSVIHNDHFQLPK